MALFFVFMSLNTALNEIEITLKFKSPTHAPENLPIPTLVYFINTLDGQSSGRGRGGPNYFKVGDLFKKICTSLYVNFRKKSHLILPVEGLKLCLDFLCNVRIT